jgi:anaerobic ribonucleoside-triphosphate reductase
MKTQASTNSETLTEKDLLQSQRTRCEVWTRVMGYHRPVDNFNVGKKAEHYSRNHFSEQATINSKFCQQFA